MRILVDARLLRRGGIGRYVRELSERWLTSPGVDAVRFVGRPEELEPWLAHTDTRGVASVHPLDAGPYSLRAQLSWFGRSPGAGRCDVTFFPHYDVPLAGCPKPAVVTVHDLIHFQAPRGFPAWKRWAGATLLRGAVARASRVVAISRATAEALEAFVPGAAGKVTVVHNGVSEAFLPPFPPDPVGLESRWGGLRPFALTVAPDKRHKNLALALEAVAEAARRIPPGADGTAAALRMVMIGVGPTVPEGLARRAVALGVGDRLVALPTVSDEELRWLYRNCAALLWPSLAEGFGLPPLEAAGCGAPVLAGDTAVSRELLPGVALVLPLDDPGAWGDALRQAADRRGGSATAVDAEIRRRFSWDQAARATLGVLAGAAERG